jgi:hypothetical protein
MPRSFRVSFTTLLIVLHAAIALGGPCLHGLPVWGHRAASASRTAHDGPRRDPGHAPHAPNNDCPVCHFFCQGQVPLERVRVMVCMRADALIVPERPTTRPHSCSRISSPRAPPATSASAA